MVDFKKHLGRKTAAKSLDPLEIYKSLDRASDKGDLRPLQKVVLSEWHTARRADRDVILKVHTGQGKTLLGLLMLQSKLNEGKGPALYLCPNHFLVNQTLEQARQFGVHCVAADGELPDEFLEGRAILIAVLHKLFNGQTKFDLGAKSVAVGTILLDDAHACMDKIQDQCVITLRHDKPNESTAYNDLLSLFENELRSQGDGTFEDILRHEFSAYLPVPYWAWWDRSSDVAGILSRHAKIDAVAFAWPLLKDALRHTLCLVSGTQIVIAPHIAPLHMFGSYANAEHRIFMSATVTDDSFLVKGLGLSPETVQNPLVDPKETWSGEKMVVMPSLIDGDLTRANIVEAFAASNPARKYGIVVLVPSGKRCADWGKYGARVVDKFTIDAAVSDLRNKDYNKTVVVANYYDGIDLPDNTCRILIIDSKPFAEELLERYIEDRRHGSKLLAGRIARIVEQGMGRAVRGEKDFCVIILIGTDLLRALQAPGRRDFFSDQTRTQIEIGRNIAEFARDEIVAGKPPTDAFRDLIGQCLDRNDDWKDYYTERMNAMAARGSAARPEFLKMFQAEVAAEREFQDGSPDRAVEKIQKLIDVLKPSAADRGWYLQEVARYTYALSKARADEFQRTAHQINRSLLRPKEGMIFTKVPTLAPEKRLERIKDWLVSHEVFENVAIAVDDIFTNLSFGVDSDKFEAAMQDLATALGFESDRPDKEWKEGPDNLWGLRDNEYLLFEDKNEVEMSRSEINKRESDQMNRSSAWFGRYYPGSGVTRIMIIPTKKVAPAAAFTEEPVENNFSVSKRLSERWCNSKLRETWPV
jgi:replicative superfamily II helicase